MKGLLALKETGKILSLRLRGHVNNEIIIGLLFKNNTRRLYSGKDSIIIRVLICLNKPYSSVCNFKGMNTAKNLQTSHTNIFLKLKDRKSFPLPLRTEPQ
jgi:hypothetical protein